MPVPDPVERRIAKAFQDGLDLRGKSDDVLARRVRELEDILRGGSPAAQRVAGIIAERSKLQTQIESLRALPDKWRNNYPPFPPGRYSASAGGALNACADELERALAAPTEEEKDGNDG